MGTQRFLNASLSRARDTRGGKKITTRVSSSWRHYVQWNGEGRQEDQEGKEGKSEGKERERRDEKSDGDDGKKDN